MIKRKLIAIHGLPGSGKDTIANFLVSSGGWSKVSFASPIKRGISTMLNIPIEDIENPEIKNQPNYKFGRSIRYLGQTLGTEWGRQLVSDSVWVDIGEESIRHAWSQKQNVVNSDLRFENEARRIKELGGYIIHVIRPLNKFTELSSKTGVSNHISDVILDESFIDATIINDGSLDNLYTNVVELLNKIYWYEEQ